MRKRFKNRSAIALALAGIIIPMIGMFLSIWWLAILEWLVLVSGCFWAAAAASSLLRTRPNP